MLPFLLLLVPLVAGHQAFWDPSMFGFNVSSTTFSYDNRPVTPLMNLDFDQWWFHNHLGYPPHAEDVFELPAGQNVTAQIACDKSATTFWNTSTSGGDVQDPNDPNNPCPGYPTSQYHTTGLDDVKGCALAIAYKSDVSQVTPEDFVVFSVNQTCVWNRYTDFGVPQRMPPCPDNMCLCAFFWIHSPDSGAEQNYMNGFQCRITDSVSNVGLATPQVARRCGADPDNGKPDADPGNCTYGAKAPLYWFQAQDNNMFEGTYAPPYYNDLYNFVDGAQEDIFQDSYATIPVPGPNQTALPVLAQNGPVETASVPDSTAASTLLTSAVSAPSTLPSSAQSVTSVTATSVLPSTTHSSTSNWVASASTPASHPTTSVSGSSTSPSAAPTVPTTNTSAIATSPSTSPSSSQCANTKRSTHSRRHVPVERGFGHKAVGMRRSRRLALEKKSDTIPI